MIPPGEKIIETKKCRLSGQEFVITDKDLQFYEKMSPVFGGKQYLIPTPTLCPYERTRRRFCFRNERALYRRKCDKSGKDIIAIYSPDKPQTLYDSKIWWSDDWSPFEYGSPVNFETIFFTQVASLIKNVPALPIINAKSENSDYTNYSNENRDSYMSVGTSGCENALFCYRVTKSRNLMDCYDLGESDHCYECSECTRLSNCNWCFSCHNSNYLYACYDCQNCNNCIGCSNLRGKSFCVNNVPVTKEAYEAELLKMLGKTGADSLRHIRYSVPQRCFQQTNTENCLGDNLTNCQHCYESYTLKNSEHCRYSQVGTQGIHSMDVNFFDFSDHQLEITNTIKSYGGIFGALNWYCQNAAYSYSCFNAIHVFGCVGLKKGSHCILNKVYAVQEYETLCSRIIDHMNATGEWGEFFPHELSPFGYNETVAQEYYPLAEAEVKAKGWSWYHEPGKTFDGQSIVPFPISEYDEKIVGFETAQQNIDTVLNGIIQCEVTGKPFKIIRQELVFYIEHSLPIPTKHPDQRHKERMSLINNRALFENTCSECRSPIISTYVPGGPETVLCEECYRKLVY